MTIKNLVVSIFAVAAFGSAVLAQGGQQPPREGMGRGGERQMGERGMMRMQVRRPGGPGGIDFNRLNLTDAQKQRIQTLLENNRRTSETNRAQFEEMGKLMGFKRQGLLTTEQGTRLTALQAQMKTDADRRQNELMAVFTPEQKTLVEQMQNERGRGMRGMGGGQNRRMLQMRRMPGAPNRPNRPNQPPPPPPSQNN